MHELVGRVAAVDAECADWAVLQAAVWRLAAVEVVGRRSRGGLRPAIATVSSFPEKSIAEAGGSSLRQAEQVLTRATTVEQVPAMGASLDAGRVSGEHVDVLTRTLRQLEPAQRTRLVEAGPGLVLVAEQVTAEEFARTRACRSATVRTRRRRVGAVGAAAAGGALEHVDRPGLGDGTLVSDLGPRRPWSAWRTVSMPKSKHCSTTLNPRVVRPICWRNSRSCEPTLVGVVDGNGVRLGDRRSSSSKTTPTRSAMGDRHWIGGRRRPPPRVPR